jgi:phage tail-like protein
MSPGITEYEPITLSRGVTHDIEFENWANKAWHYAQGDGQEVSLADFRQDIIIELYNEAGQLVIAYKVFRCCVSDFVALPELTANKAAVAIESLTLVHEGWLRDESVSEPTETKLKDMT